MDRIEKIKRVLSRVKKNSHGPLWASIVKDVDWLLAEVERLQAEVTRGNLVYQKRLAEIEELKLERDDLRAKLAQIQQDDDLRQHFKWYCITCMERFYFPGDCPICLGKLRLAEMKAIVTDHGPTWEPGIGILGSSPKSNACANRS